MKIGAKYFITTNGNVLVSFETFKEGVALPDRRVKPYDLRMRITEETISKGLEDLARIHIGVETPYIVCFTLFYPYFVEKGINE